jgi:hypothetical protein
MVNKDFEIITELTKHSLVPPDEAETLLFIFLPPKKDFLE